MQDIRKIPSKVKVKIVMSDVMAQGENCDECCNVLYNFSSLIDKLSKKQHVSLPCSLGGEIVHVEATE